MPIDDQELRAICLLALRVRRQTSGAGPWDEVGLLRNLRKLKDRNLHMTIEHVLRHAADPTAKTPGVLLGAFTPAAPTGAGRAQPPRRSEMCLTCGRHLDACTTETGCGEKARRPRPADPAVAAAALTACRDALGGGL